MRPIEINAERLVSTLLQQDGMRHLALLDSCGVGKPGSNRLIAGIDPVEVLEISSSDPDKTLAIFGEKLADERLAAIFTISFDLGPKMIGKKPLSSTAEEPDIFVALFDGLFIHDYDVGRTFIAGRPESYEELLRSPRPSADARPAESAAGRVRAASNFTGNAYIAAIEEIKELIRSGETYQTNLTQQLTVQLNSGQSAALAFEKLRKVHPAPYAAYIDRGRSTVVSASPEQFIKLETKGAERHITSSPIKGTRPRGVNEMSDVALRSELLASEKDRAENKMIVDLIRNDLGRICEFGSVSVARLCHIEEHPSLFHLVSTVTGVLRDEVNYEDMLRAVFPCGSITGAPKIRTMDIIDRLEPDPRGLSMGAVGFRIPKQLLGTSEAFEMSVAIRTMVIRDNSAMFNVGGGIVIDSGPEAEYDESIVKARALLSCLNALPPPK